MRAVNLTTVVCRLLGAVLIAAAVLKAVDLSSGVTPPGSLLSSRFLQNALVNYELALGITLILAPTRPWLWRVAVATFILFACVATYQVGSGAGSCGCFGRLRVNPRYTAALDIVAVTALIGTRLSRGTRWHPPTRFGKRWAATAVAAVVAMAAAIWAASGGPSAVAAGDGVFVSEKYVVLDPPRWLGKRFPLAPQIDIGDRLMLGHRLVVLFRADCEHCQRAVPRYEALASVKGASSEPAIALVELPPLEPSGGAAISSQSRALRGSIRDRREWLAQTPVRLEIADGKVLAVAEGEAAEFPPADADFALQLQSGAEGRP